MRQREAVLVDSGAWIARAPSRRRCTSIPVVIETFSFLARNANRDVALTWKEAVDKPRTVTILPCERLDLEQSWGCFRRADLHKLSAVGATSFLRSRDACGFGLPYAFDHHF